MQPPISGVKVRMYRTGLGDCFLLAFPRSHADNTPPDAFYLLVDCGVYKSTPDGAAKIEAIVKDIHDATGGRLDLLVITHEHWDHVSAFHQTQAQKIFENDIKLNALWMAWTENLNIPLAKQLHDGRKAARMALVRSLATNGGAYRVLGDAGTRCARSSTSSAIPWPRPAEAGATAPHWG